MPGRQVGFGHVIIVVGIAITALATVRLASARSDTDRAASTARIDRIVAAIALGGLGLALIAIGLLWPSVV